jgi:multidrug resistance efflux pump
VESERDSLKTELEAVKAGLERAKQHVTVLQSRRDQMRDEIAKLKVALGQAPDAIG